MKEVLVLSPNGWGRTEFGRSRHRGRHRFHFEGFDLFRFPENARLAFFDARRSIDRIVAKYARAGLAGVTSNEEQLGATNVSQLFERCHCVKRELAFEFA